MNNKNLIINLRKLVNKYNYLYYVLGKPVVSDIFYDAMLLKLNNIEKKYLKNIDAKSPSENIGYNEDIANILENTKLNNMLSLEKSFSKLDIIKFQYRTADLLKIYKKNHIICEPKIDGLAAILIYDNNKLRNIVTRKDGINILSKRNISDIVDNIPNFIKNNGITLIKGELYLSRKNFNKLNFFMSKKKKKYLLILDMLVFLF